ncbi:MAG TPA: hypothetical protein VNV41_10420 [Candidatus Acidoferrales bacterium]|nr:hypothetical protein [Candidatus Acidoferrales bacterium]
MAVVPASDAGGRPAAHAATHSSAKTSVHVDTVFSFTPHTGFSSTGKLVTVATAAAAQRRGRFPRDLRFDIAVLL